MMRHRRFLMGVYTALAVVGCDTNSPTEPHSQNELAVPYGVTIANASGSTFTASAISATEIDLAWQNPSPKQLTGFQIFRSATGPAGVYSLIASVAATATQYADVALTPSTNYCYEIRSYKTAGRNTTYSAYSAPACATTLAPPVVAPSETNATPYGSTITVVWKDNSTDEDGFRIEQATTTAGPWTLVATVGANVVTTNIDYVPQDHIVCFRVTAFNTVGASLPSTADCTALPATPTNLSAKSLDQQTITLTWTDNSAVEDGYRISRLQSGSGWVDIATVGANIASYVDAAALANTSYTYRVQAVKDGGYSLASNEVVAVIATAPPAAPENAAVDLQPHCTFVDGCFGADLNLYWNDVSTNEEGFRIEYSTDGVNGWSLFTQTGPNVNGLVMGPTVSYGCFRVIAFNGAGSSSPSNVVCGDAYGN
ncbi:MAG TPA: fibronectin type III domain-containing protein [Gemmatimonadaceae bacterium]